MIVMLLLKTTPAKDGTPRRMWAAWDTRGAGRWAGIDRFTTGDSGESALRLLERLKGFDCPKLSGPTLSVSPETFFGICDACSGHARRNAKRKGNF